MHTITQGDIKMYSHEYVDREMKKADGEALMDKIIEGRGW